MRLIKYKKRLIKFIKFKFNKLQIEYKDFSFKAKDFGYFYLYKRAYEKAPFCLVIHLKNGNKKRFNYTKEKLRNLALKHILYKMGIK